MSTTFSHGPGRCPHRGRGSASHRLGGRVVHVTGLWMFQNAPPHPLTCYPKNGAHLLPTTGSIWFIQRLGYSLYNPYVIVLTEKRGFTRNLRMSAIPMVPHLDKPRLFGKTPLRLRCWLSRQGKVSRTVSVALLWPGCGAGL